MTDFEKTGFKAGLEIHQQLDTEHKLFCDCPTEKSEEFPVKVERRLRAVAGELGRTDLAARREHEKQRVFEYALNPETSCLIELDEEPPRPLNQEALDVALQVCKALKSDVFGEIQVMRKTVVDGSNTTGFQRTALVGMGGFVETSKGKVGVTNVQIEEDSATPLEKQRDKVVYRLDRLGVPLIELGTTPDIKDGQHLKETALAIGALLRATGKAKRGLGTIRQDLNISIKGGTRVEIKGVQEPSLFPVIAEREIQRQQALLEVKKELEKKKARPGKSMDVTALFKKTDCRFVKKASHVEALVLHGFAGVLGREVQPGRRVGTEFSDHAKTAGVGGIIHSDEDLSKYNIMEMPAVKKKLGAGKQDAIVLVASDKNRARRAVERVSERATQFLSGVPQEVRKALPEGNTSFLRPMPGASRLYPETDCPPVLITSSRLKKIPVPEKPLQTRKRLLKMGLSEDLVEKLVGSPNLPLFDLIAGKTKNPALVASTLEDTLTSLRRDGFAVDSITDEQFQELFQLYDKKEFAKESIPKILEALSLNPGKPVKKTVDSLGLERAGKDELRNSIKKIVEKNKDALSKPSAFNIIMGQVMKELRGKADGALIAKIVKEEIKP
jgi:glutamyl-tRNA(Gln) amidotransferase subunit E